MEKKNTEDKNENKIVKYKLRDIIIFLLIIAVILLVGYIITDWSNKNEKQKAISQNETLNNATLNGYLICLNQTNNLFTYSLENCQPIPYNYYYQPQNKSFQINFYSANCLKDLELK